MKNRLFVAFFLFCTLGSQAQDDLRYKSHPWMIRANAQYGLMLPEYAFMSRVTDDFVRATELSVIRLPRNKNLWDKLYRYPSFGVSLYFTTMGSKEHFGNQFSLYPYYGLNIMRRKNFELGYQMGVGISYATKKYSPDQNYQNLAIGSHFNLHYHADLIAQYHLHNNFFIHGGITFTHISNANLSEPNVGINTCAVFTGVGWAFGAPDTDFTEEIPEFTPRFNYEIMIAGGMKHTRTFESFQYPAVSVSFDVKRRFGYKFALGIGADFFYDSSTEPQMIRLNKEFSSSDAYTSGIHLAQEFFYNRFSVMVQEGFYVGLTDKLFGYSMYNRAIVRYRFTEHFFVNFSLKTHLYILDFPELGIGYYW